MVAPHLCALLRVVRTVRPAFTVPTFCRLLVLFAGWVMSPGTHAVTEALVASGVAGVQHHAAFHRVLSRAVWRPDDVGRLLLLALVRLSGGGPLRLVLDDTLCTHKGPKVFGLGTHLDAVRSTRAVRHFAFGHLWVVLAVLVQVPFARRPWAVPVLLRLYRTKKECERRRVVHQSKTRLGRDMVQLALSWLPDGQRVRLVADGLYSCDTVLKGLPHGRLVFFGAMRPDARLSRPRTRKCRSPKTGRPLTADLPVPKPHVLARDTSRPWVHVRATLYGGEEVQLRVKEVVARWRSAAGTQTLKVVLVQVKGGSLPLRVFFSTDATLPAHEVLEEYAGRWAIEVLFRDLKQSLGFAASRARTRLAVLRTAPFVAYCYTLLVLWYVELSRSAARLDTKALRLPTRPWYRQKDFVSFADVLRMAQATLASTNWRASRRFLADLHDTPHRNSSQASDSSTALRSPG